MASESISLSTPARQRRYYLDQHDAQSVRQYASSLGDPFCYGSFEEFASKYLREQGPVTNKQWIELRDTRMKELKESPVETYQPIASLLNWISRFYCKQLNGKNVKQNTPCLLFKDTHAVPPVGIPGCTVRPDITGVYSTYKQVNGILKDEQHGGDSKKNKQDPPQVHWQDIVTFIEAKHTSIKPEDRNQAGGYASRVPISRPEVAGVLYAVIGSQDFTLHWSDASGIVRCPRTRWDDDPSLTRLFRFVKTLYLPMDAMPQLDESITMKTKGEPNAAEWTIKTRFGGTYTGKRIRSTAAYGRQTFVWRATRQDENTGRVHIIKDSWRDKRRRFREQDLYKKARGVRGVAQMQFGETVAYAAADGSLKPLETSKEHSGKDMGKDREVPQRVKERIVLNTTGKPLWKRKSVLQLLKALYDTVQAHQVLVNNRRILHRDISPNNILINPEHNDACKFDTIEGAKYINQVLNPGLPNDEYKEEAAVIDLDNAADMANRDASDERTHRTGTRKYIAKSVAWSTVQLASHRYVKEFPVLKGKALDLYIQAYGREIYDTYTNAFNGCEKDKETSERVQFEHLPHHDMESVIYIIIESLIKAWPEKKDQEMSWNAAEVIRGFEKHEVWEKNDSRSFMGDYSTKDWMNALHPALASLASMLAELAWFLKTDWLLWTSSLALKEDFLHEALKRILLQEIVRINEENSDVSLEEKERIAPPRDATARPLGGADDSPTKGKRGSSHMSSDRLSKRGRTHCK